MQLAEGMVLAESYIQFTVSVILPAFDEPRG
jgi:hypothetical protein